MRIVTTVLTVLLLASLGGAEESLHERVDEAIDRGVAYLKKRGPKGDFGRIGGERNYEGGTDVYRYPHGCTALALLTLLKCGVPADDPIVKAGFAHLEKLGRIPASTYEIATLILALEARTNRVKRERKLESIRRMRAKPGEQVDLRIKLPGRDKAWMTSLTKALLQRWDNGAWRYGLPSKVSTGDHDMSNTQYAMMALYTAWRCGVKVPPRTIQKTMIWTLDQQETTGPEHPRYVPKSADREYAPPIDRARGWCYIKGSPHSRDGRVTGSMTTGGLIVLITGRAILRDRSPRLLKQISARTETGIHDGLAWLDRHWSVIVNPPLADFYVQMYLYGLERVGDLLRVHLIGRHDWYREGAEALVESQHGEGQWYSSGSHQPKSLLSTCFALLFLERATLAATTKRD